MKINPGNLNGISSHIWKYITLSPEVYSKLLIVKKIEENMSNRKWQDYVYIQCEYKSTKQKIKHLLREENKVKENKIS